MSMSARSALENACPWPTACCSSAAAAAHSPAAHKACALACKSSIMAATCAAATRRTIQSIIALQSRDNTALPPLPPCDISSTSLPLPPQPIPLNRSAACAPSSFHKLEQGCAGACAWNVGGQGQGFEVFFIANLVHACDWGGSRRAACTRGRVRPPVHILL